MKGTVHYEVRGNIALLRIDNPPVNALSSGVRQGLYDLMDRLAGDDALEAAVLTGEGRAFIAGADITEFGGKMEGASLLEAMSKIENSGKPVVAAINGTAFGGGLEVALCCHHRVAAATAQVGLPEVNLGLLPGAGGTQRLPRLVGAAAALQIMTTGAPVPAARALDLGVVDQVVEGDVVEAAMAFAQGLKDEPEAVRLRKIRDIGDKTRQDRDNSEIFAQVRAVVAKTRRMQFAPEQIIQCVETAVSVEDFDAGLAFESERFMECLNNPQREAMIHVFFNERNVAKVADIPRDTPKIEPTSAAVVGSGTMGGGIAMCFANRGIPVVMLDMDEKNLERGLGVIEKNYASQVKRKRITQQQMDQRVGLITGSLKYADLSDADIVIEAVYENLELKREIFTQLDEVMKEGALLATNTSGLDVEAIGAATKRPEAVCGMHFFSPANVMRLLEVVRAERSDIRTLASAMAIGKRLGKVAVMAGNCPGFIGNRMLSGYMRQAGLLILEGALPAQVDEALYDFGMNMGPFRMADLVGLDLGWRARKMAGGSNDIITRIPDAICEMGHYGQKTGKGYYLYKEGSREAHPAPDVEELIVKTSSELGYKRRQIEAEEIVERCIYALINEGARILEEGIAQRAGDIDIVYINGYGFPVWRGGPMHYANQTGLAVVCERIREFERQHGEFWAPAPLLERLAAGNEQFGDAPPVAERAPVRGRSSVV